MLCLKQQNSDVFDNILFLHTDSGRKEKDYENRQKKFKKIWSMKSAIVGIGIQQRQARFMALGDLNTMGRSKVDSKPAIGAKEEIETLSPCGPECRNENVTKITRQKRGALLLLR